jgi:regulator of protease activity HflC (stomatin/prohibitin superfamily)
VNAATWILVLILAPTVLFIVWLVLLETSVKIDPGTIGLALLRGKSTGRTLTPGRHFVRPWQKLMIQKYPSRELALVAGGVQQANPDVDYLDEPVSVLLSDQAVAEVSYTVRCQLIEAKVHEIHESYGPEGIWSVLRDVSRRTLISESAGSGITIGNVFGDGYGELERHVSAALTDALAEVGFELKLFSLREVDLGVTGEIVQDTIRAGAELEREQAYAAVRRARIDNDGVLLAEVDGLDHELVLRYRQVDAWRDLIERWGDGARHVPSLITTQLTSPSMWAATMTDHDLDQSRVDAGAADGQAAGEAT